MPLIDVCKMQSEIVSLDELGVLRLNTTTITSDVKCIHVDGNNVLYAICGGTLMRFDLDPVNHALVQETQWRTLCASDPNASCLCIHNGTFFLGTDAGWIQTQKVPDPPTNLFRASGTKVSKLVSDDISDTVYACFENSVIRFNPNRTSGSIHVASPSSIDCIAVASRSLYFVSNHALRRIDRYGSGSILLKSFEPNAHPVSQIYISQNSLAYCRMSSHERIEEVPLDATDNTFLTISVPGLQPFVALSTDVTPVSALVSWTSHAPEVPESNSDSETLYAIQVSRVLEDGTTSRMRKQDFSAPSFKLLGLEPSTTYEVKILVKNSSSYKFSGCECCFSTTPASAEAFSQVYESLKTLDVVDLTALDSQGTSNLKRFLNEVGTSGDQLELSLNVRGKRQRTSAKLAKSGDLVQLDDGQNVFLPFEASGTNQSITATLEDQTLVIVYDEVLDRVIVDGIPHNFGESVRIGRKKIIITRGSLVLLFEDNDLETFAYDGLQSEVESAGTFAVGDTVCGSTSLIKAKAASGNTVIETSSHVRGTSGSATVTEIGRFECSADSLIETGTVSWSVLGDGASKKTIDANASRLQVTSESVLQTLTTEFDSDGVHFDSSDSGIYFGASKQFRLKYVEGDESLCFQHLNGGSYVTKAAFTDD